MKSLLIPLLAALLIVDTEGMPRVHDLVEKELAAKQYSGVVTLVALNGKIVHFEAQGQTDIEANRAMPKDAIFRLASMSKVVAAVAALILVDEKKIELTDPVSRFLPEFKDLKVAVADSNATGGYKLVPADRQITVRDLLTHTSGLGSGPASLAAIAKEPQQPNDNLAAIISRLPHAPLDFQPGSKWAYSGLAGFDTLGRIIEVASGKSLEQFIQERICRPLGMKDTTFVPTSAQRARLVTFYTRDKGQLVKSPNQNLLVDPVCYHGAGGLLGTAEDYYRFAQMLANGGESNGHRILSKNIAERLASPEIAPGLVGLPPGYGWGLGVRYIANGAPTRSPLSAGSYGWSGAWGTHFWIDPSKKLVAIYMANETTAGGAGAVSARDFESAVMQSL